jgi:hypothetical protein
VLNNTCKTRHRTGVITDWKQGTEINQLGYCNSSACKCTCCSRAACSRGATAVVSTPAVVVAAVPAVVTAIPAVVAAVSACRDRILNQYVIGWLKRRRHATKRPQHQDAIRMAVHKEHWITMTFMACQSSKQSHRVLMSEERCCAPEAAPEAPALEEPPLLSPCHPLLLSVKNSPCRQSRQGRLR